MEGENAWLPTKAGFLKRMLEESWMKGYWVFNGYWLIGIFKYRDCNDSAVFYHQFVDENWSSTNWI